MSRVAHAENLRADTHDLATGALPGIIVGAGITGLVCTHAFCDPGIAARIVEKSAGELRLASSVAMHLPRPKHIRCIAQT